MKTRFQRYCVLCFLLFALVLRARASEPVLEQILKNGPVDNRINLVFLSEGFTEAELDMFVSSARSVYLSSVLATPPFADYKNYFNAFAIRVASAESGSDHPSSNSYRDTYFNSSYDFRGSDRWIEIPPNLPNSTFAAGKGKVQTLLHSFGFVDSARTIPILLVNDNAYGGSGDGSGLEVAVVSLSPLGVRVLLHELGHSLARLGDEYVDSCGCPPREHANTTREYRRDFIPWHHWIENSTPIPTTDASQIGLFEGAEYTARGWFRSQRYCIMNVDGGNFCAVCSEALVREFHTRVQQVEAFTPATHNLRASHGVPIRFAISLLDPDSHELKIQWQVDKQLAASDSLEFTLNPASLTGGTHSVLAIIHDDTSRVRDDPEGKLTTMLAWTVNVPEANAQLTVKSLDAQRLLLHVTSPAGRLTAIESSENLIHWQTMTKVINTTGNMDLLVDLADQTVQLVLIQSSKNLAAGRKVAYFVGLTGTVGPRCFYRASVPD